MNKQEYLDQISARAPVQKKGLPGFLTSKFFWIVIGTLLGLALILGVGSALSGNKTSTEDKVSELVLQIAGLNEVIGSYQGSVKSSTLRGYSASLSSVLSNTNSQLTSFATETYKFKEKNVDEEIQNRVAEHIQELDNELFSAKITGNLDEIFDLKMVYEISLIASQEQSILSTAKNSALVDILSPSLDSLSNLSNEFDQYTLGM